MELISIFVWGQVFRSLVVLCLPQLQPERPLLEGRARELWGWCQLVPLEGLPLLSQEHCHENQASTFGTYNNNNFDNNKYDNIYFV
jgi:hypothetical protein